ncbi:RTA1 like protein-domain-containing protein [Mycena alexandri]|uniref:RTA1 like protein-domain-containing protein n=1 Tax=Mycena alexandri TaxID=1745969 RepID=A0AAD6XBR0_9AGAR|nr:RTA1 like protein-domain-containing protein [Mycena alexandri]
MSRFFRSIVLSALFAAVLAQDGATNSTSAEPEAGSNIPIAGFLPKNAPAIVALTLYAISASVLWINFFVIAPRRRFMLTLTIGMTTMAAGFALRIEYISSPFSVGAYIATDLFILLSPCFFLATDYMLLSHLAASFDEGLHKRCLLIRHSLIVKIFVWSDVSTFLLQSSGGGLTSTNETSLVNLGNNLTMIGLILQAVSFLLFTVVLLIFGLRVCKGFPDVWYPKSPHPFKIVSRKPIDDWRILFYVLCVTSVCILCRSIFRITEFAGGYTGYVAMHEGFFYAFDALPLWLGMSIFCFVWPVRALPTHSNDLGLNNDISL